IEDQRAIAEEPGTGCEPVVDATGDDVVDLGVLQDARAEVQVREEYPAREAPSHSRVGEDLFELSEDETLWGRTPARGRDVPPVEADDLVTREPLDQVRVRTALAEAELDDDPRPLRETPGGEVDVVPLRDLLADVGVESAHDAGPSDPPEYSRGVLR